MQQNVEFFCKITVRFENKMVDNLFGKNLKALRLANNLTQKQLGKIFKVANQTISFWENGAREPDLDMLKEIGIYFGVAVDVLLSDKMEELWS